MVWSRPIIIIIIIPVLKIVMIIPKLKFGT